MQFPIIDHRRPENHRENPAASRPLVRPACRTSAVRNGIRTLDARTVFNAISKTIAQIASASFCGIILLLSATSSQADTTVILPAVTGQRIVILNPTDAGDVNYIGVYNDTGNIQHGLVLFDLSVIPVGAKIYSANMELTRLDPWLQNGAQTEVYRLTTNWIPSDTSWLNRANGVPWNTAGGDFVGETGLSGIAPYAINSDQGGGPHFDFDITQLAREWFTGQSPNYGMLLLGSLGNTMHYLGSASASGPTLTVTYITGITILSQSQSQLGYWGKTASFSVSATNYSTSGPLNYQWLQNSVLLPGATNTTLILTNLQSTNAGAYTVIVSDSLGNSVTSAPPAILTVNPAGVSLALYAGVTVSGVVGQTYGVQSTTDLGPNTWTGLTNVTLSVPSQIWYDSQPANQSQRYYRVVPGPISIP